MSIVRLRHRWSARTLFGGEFQSVSDCLVSAFKQGADLRYVDLSGANLAGIRLPGIALCDARLTKATLVGADLNGANLENADFFEAVLVRASLIRANLARCDLRLASLTRADFEHANLEGASLEVADLNGANFLDANLSGVQVAPCGGLPEAGAFTGYKKLRDGLVATLEILPEAQRTGLILSRECRASGVRVLGIHDGDKEVSQGVAIEDSRVRYEVGQVVEVEGFNKSPLRSGPPGVFFFLTKKEALHYEREPKGQIT